MGKDNFVQCGCALSREATIPWCFVIASFAVGVKKKNHMKSNDQVSDQVKPVLRGRFGAISWRAQQSGLWLVAECSILQASVIHTTCDSMTE